MKIVFNQKIKDSDLSPIQQDNETLHVNEIVNMIDREETDELMN